MPNLDLGDLEAARVSQNRNEPVQLTIDANLPHDLTFVELEAAVVIMQATAGRAADHPVEYTAGINLVPGIMASFFPAADHIVALIKFGEEARNLGRVVLKITVQGEDLFAPRRLKSGREGRRLAEIAPKADRPQPMIAPGQGGEHLPRTIATSIIHENEFDRPPCAGGEHGVELTVKRGQAFCLIMHRYDNADHE